MSSGVASFASLLAALFFCAERALAQAPARAADAAAGEREVVWYTAMNTPDAAPLRKRFREKYPDLNLTILRQPEKQEVGGSSPASSNLCTPRLRFALPLASSGRVFGNDP